MRCDVHTHLFGVEQARTGCLLRLERIPRIPRFALARHNNLTPEQLRSPGIDDRIARRLLAELDASGLDHAVVLAMDEVHDGAGEPAPGRTVMRVPNDYLFDVAQRSPKVRVGASIHPYRRDAIEQLQRVAERGAVLIKWIPSAQWIDLEHPRCMAFYDALARLRLPLLCHVGAEHVLPGGPSEMNAPARLRPALERGVTIIAGHCGARLFPGDPDHLPQWLELTTRYPHLYGDVSAYGYPLRRFALAKILRHETARERILFGSDFPSPLIPLSYAGRLPFTALTAVRRTANRFDQAAVLMEQLLPPEAFTRPYRVLPALSRARSP